MTNAIALVSAMMTGADTTVRATDSIRGMLDMTALCRGRALAAGYGCTLPAGKNWFVNVENVLVEAGFMVRSTRVEWIHDEQTRRAVTRVALTAAGRAWLKANPYIAAA